MASKFRVTTGRVLEVSVGDYRMHVGEDMRWAFAGGSYYERTVAAQLIELMKSAPRPVFYDVGANQGFYSLLLAPLAEVVHAFEPVVATHALLSANVRRNPINNVTVHRLGLSDVRGQAEINLFSSSGNNSLFDVHVASNLRRTGRQVVELWTIDDLVMAHGLAPPGLIKMDVEGGELNVLRGARQVVRKYQPVIAAEYYPPHFEQAGYRGEDLLVELTNAGYSIFGIPEDPADGQLYPQSRFAEAQIGNIVAMPPASGAK